MSHTPIGGHPQGWDHKLADRSSLPPASGEEKNKSHSKHVFAQPHMPKQGHGGAGAGAWRSETEGSSGSSAQSARSLASPPYMRWARSLHDLLEDAEGVRLFRQFVGGAGALHVDRLNFHFAVQGLRQEHDQHKIRQVVSAIYKFLRKSALAMPEELKARVKAALRDGAPLERTVFDHMEQEVTRAITESTYQAFLRSEAYVSYVSAATQPLSSPDEPPAPAQPHREVGAGAGAGLPTLHEGQELSAGAARLTQSALLATQARRLHDVAPKHRAKSVYSAHVTYAGYCPASRQDSERASLSSGRADSDAVSLSGSSVDGAAARGGRERERRRTRPPAAERLALINKEQDTAMVIPRTQRVSAEALRVLPPAEFAPLLIEKLERVRRDQDLKERLDRRLQEGDGEDAATQALPPQLVAAAIREKLQLDDDNDQDILDQHVSRVWSERTPGASPPGGRRRARAHGPHAHAHAHGRRAPSALSADSGHCDASEPLPSVAHSRSFSKKTVTELTDSGVSVVSEGAASGAAEPRILLWIAEGSERLERRRDLRERERELRDRDASRGSSADRDDYRRRAQPPPRARGSGKTAPGGGGAGGAGGAEAQTVVVVSFLDEAVPYRLKVPAAPLTLKVFKDFLPRKGNYRYFFKTECADLDNTVIQEEVSNDSDTLPMFEGKVMARVKAIE